MSARHHNLSLVVDEVLADARAATQRRDAEIHAVKTAAAEPRTEEARGLRRLATDLRTMTDDITYDDLAGAS